MWNAIVGIIPPGLVILCTTLSVLIPLAMFKLFDKLYELGDPPWKKKKVE